MKPLTVLVNDGNADYRAKVAARLKEKGYEVIEAGDGREGLHAFVERRPDVVVTELEMSPVGGLEFLRRAKPIRATTPVLVLTSLVNEDSILQALRLGAADFLSKAISFVSIENAIRNAVHGMETVSSHEPADGPIIGDSPAIEQLRQKIDKIARIGRSTVLILGESGTGKELVANQLHARSGCSGSFVPLNCAVSDGGLIENSLFGHERGAFTDAKTRERGLIEYADQGTLFLDEVGEMNGEMQAKLLRFLETGTFRRVGGHEEIRVQVRIIAATHRDLPEMVKAGAFREDLFFRLNVLPIYVPALRERGDDVFRLAEHFIRKAAERVNLPPPPISDGARGLLATHDWPGNVRELKNLMERFVLLQEGLTVDLDDLPSEVRNMAGPVVQAPPEPRLVVAREPTDAGFFDVPYADARKTFERQYFMRLLTEHRGNVASVARASGVDPSNVRRMLRKHELDAGDFRT